MTRHAFYTRTWAKLLRHNHRWNLLEPGDRVLVAVSGGPDSVCLAHFLDRLARRLKLDIRIIHFHHGLRGREAERDARFVRAMGGVLHRRTYLCRIPVARTAEREGRSLEDAGRTLRYRRLAQYARLLKCNKVALGHQLDDVAETVLLNVLRGTKAQGLAGIPPKRKLAAENPSVEVVRPLSCLSRGEILDYLKHHRLDFVTDRSNMSLRHSRNWVRHILLPLLQTRNPQIRAHLAEMALDLRTKLDLMERVLR